MWRCSSAAIRPVAVHEPGQHAALAQEVEQEVRGGDPERSLDDHVVDRHEVDLRLAVARVAAQPVVGVDERLVEDLPERRRRAPRARARRAPRSRRGRRSPRSGSGRRTACGAPRRRAASTGSCPPPRRPGPARVRRTASRSAPRRPSASSAPSRGGRARRSPSAAQSAGSRLEVDVLRRPVRRAPSPRRAAAGVRSAGCATSTPITRSRAAVAGRQRPRRPRAR